MSRLSVSFHLISLILITLTASLLAQPQTAQPSSPTAVPAMMKFSGTITGAPSRLVGVTFALYKDQQGSAPLWLETQSVPVDGTGHYTVQLGGTVANGLPKELFVSGEARWLGVQREGQAEQPRVLLLSVPYALKAADAETLGGLPASAFVLATPSTTSPAGIVATSSPNSPPPLNAAVTGAGTVNFVPLWDTTSDIVNSVLSQTGTGATAKIGINTAVPATTLDVKGAATVRGGLNLPATGAATSTAGKISQPMNLAASAFNSGTGTAVNQTFRLQTEPAANNSATASGKLNFLFYSGTNTATETGLSIASNGQISFAAGQSFPGTGAGTITGVTAGSGLVGGGTSGNVSLSLPATCAANQILKWNGTAWACSADGNSGGTIKGVTAGTALTGGGTTGIVTLNLDTTKVPQLNTANTFTGNQTVNGNLSATGAVTGSSFQIGGSLFAFGSATDANAFLGFSGNSTMTGQLNTANGELALLSNTTGQGNTASGYEALVGNTTGAGNTASGLFALEHNTTGTDNTASGDQALQDNTTGLDNTAYGAVALQSTTIGNNNSAAGAQALANNTTGSNNTALGYNAGPDPAHTNLTNSTAIGENAVVSASNALVLGGTGADAVRVGIGTATPTSTLDVRGTGNFTGAITFAAGQTFPGTGTITGVTAGTALTGGGSSGGVTLNVDTTKVVTGITAGTGLTGGGSGGLQTLNLDTTKVPRLTTGNTFTGDQTVFGNILSSGIVGAGSYTLGSGLLAYGDAGNNDVFLGFAGNSTVAGTLNTGVGSQALGLGVSGSNNTALGALAMHDTLAGNHNTGVGFLALSAIESSNNNTAVGDSALWSAEGSGNTAIGANAGEPTNGFINTGSNNTFLGLNTTPGTQLALSNVTAVGANAEVDISNAMVLGSINGINGATANTNVGIGITAPQALLHIDYVPPAVGQDVALITSGGSTNVASLLLQNTHAGGKRLRVGAGTTTTYLASSGGLEFVTNDAGTPNSPFVPAITIDTAGNVNIPGNLSKGGGSFKIDHPLDPANKYLYHSFVESPDMMNIYNGVATLDARGAVWITLPDYFGALNRDFRYQLTSMGRPQPQLYIAKEISGSRFRIAGGKSGGRVSWQVTGIRQDAYANTHRIPVEEYKPAQEQGHYLHPELFGAAPEAAIGSPRIPSSPTGR
jgi:hypothetical protein